MAYEKKEFRYQLEKNILESEVKNESLRSELDSIEEEMETHFLNTIEFIFSGSNRKSYYNRSWDCMNNEQEIVNRALQALATKAVKVIGYSVSQIVESYNQVFDEIKPSVTNVENGIRTYNDVLDNYNNVLSQIDSISSKRN